MNMVENIYIKRDTLLKNGWSDAVSVGKLDAMGPQAVQSPRYSHVVDKFKKGQLVKSRSLSREMKIHRGKILQSPQRAALSPRTKPRNGVSFDIFSPRPEGVQNDQQHIDLLRRPKNRTPPRKQTSGPEQETMEMLMGLQSPRYRKLDVDAREMSPLSLPTQRWEKVAKWNLDSASKV